MPVLIGELEKITGAPSSVTQVMVRAHETRITGAALTTDEFVPIPVDRDGRFEVSLRPGKAIMVLVHGGRVGEGERFPLLVEEGLGTIVSAIKLASDKFDQYELDELERAAADMLASLDKGLVAATRAEVAQEGAEKAKKGSEDARDKSREHRDEARTAASTAAEEAATGAVQRADEKLTGYISTAQGHVTAAKGHAGDSAESATAADKDAGRAETARQGAETIEKNLPAKIGNELDTQLPAELREQLPDELAAQLPSELDERVPPKVAEAIAEDRAVADAAAAAIDAAAQDVDLMERSTAEELIAKGKWVRTDLTPESDLDSLTREDNAGVYRVAQSSTSTALNLPQSPTPGIVTVQWIAGVNSPSTIQIWEPAGTGARWVRRHIGGTGWQEWTAGNDLTSAAPGTDWMQVGPVGSWYIGSTGLLDTMSGLPEQSRGLIHAWSTTGATTATVRLYLTISGSAWIQGIDPATNTMLPWKTLGVEITEPDEEVEVPATAAARREELINSRGGRIGTAGKGVVALRFDHNVRPFQETVLPLLRERGLPASMAHFVDEMDPQPGYSNSDEVGKTWADVSDQFFQGVEVWSHSWSHTDAATEDDLVREIVDSRAALEDAIPEAHVEGWMQPGLVATEYMGYGPVRSAPEKWGSTLAGRLVDATYGSADRSGMTHTPLGSRTWGALWLDSQSSASFANASVNIARDTCAGLVLALHPNRVGAPGGITIATLTEILDHVVALREAGEIEVLTVAGMTVADPGSSWRQDMSRPITTGWSGGTVVGNARKASSGTTVAAAVNATRIPTLAGHVRELYVELSGSAAVTLVAKDLEGATPLNVSRTVAVNGPAKLHLPFGLPRETRNIRAEITCVSGEVEVTSAKIRAI